MTTRVAAYHSTNIDAPHVHHVFDDCVSEKQIPWQNRAAGTGGYRMCDHCRDR